MRKYLYNYQTIIRFSSLVSRHFFLLRCVPCTNACQQIEKHNLSLHPSDYLTCSADACGNPIQYGSRMQAHDSFVSVSSGEVRLKPYCIPSDSGEEVFRVPSALTGLSPSMRSFMAGIDSGNTPLECALNISRQVYEYMHYTPGSTQANTTAMQAFDQQRGVCQDYAHIMIALCRAQGIAARYVNGFMQGVGLTHAWVEVLDNGAWWGIDTTNNQQIEYGYIKLAHGRDALDCPVNRGVFSGDALQQVEIRVIVEEI